MHSLWFVFRLKWLKQKRSVGEKEFCQDNCDIMAMIDDTKVNLTDFFLFYFLLSLLTAAFLLSFLSLLPLFLFFWLMLILFD